MKQHLTFILRFFSLLFLSQSLEGKASDIHLDQTYIGVSFLPGSLYGNNYFSDHVFKLSYSTGLIFQFKSNRQFGLTTGIQFSSMAARDKLKDYIRWTPGALPNGPNPYPDDSLIRQVQNGSAFRFIDIPLIANFFIGNQNLEFIAGGGFILNYFISERLTITHVYSNNEVVQTVYINSQSDKNKIQLNPVFSFGVEKEINAQLSFKVEPTLRYQSSGLSYYSVGEQFLEIGINFSIIRRLK